MEVNQAIDRGPDRRVRRSRSALMRAAVDLVSGRGTTNIALSDIAEAADVSRQLVYQQFGDRDTLLLEAALDLAGRELLPLVTDAADTAGARDRMLATVGHFAQYRPFYRAMLTGPCAYGLTKALSGLLSPFTQQRVRRMSGGRLAPDLVEDVATFLTGGWAAVINTWLIEGADHLDAAAFTDRLAGMLSFLPLGSHPADATVAVAVAADQQRERTEL